MSQNHLTLSFPLKSPADAKAIAEELPPLMPGLFQAEDTIGTIHYSRFTVLSEKTLLFLADWLPAPKGPFAMYMRLYWPKDEATDGKWTAPPLQQVKQ